MGDKDDIRRADEPDTLHRMRPRGRLDPWKTFDASKPPVYGCLTGIELPLESFEVARGITLRRVFVDMFGASMIAFAPPPTPRAPHPGPWAAVRGGFTFESRVELAITDTGELDGMSPSLAGWLVAAVLRLQMPSPVRLAVLANMPFDQMPAKWRQVAAEAFEDAPNQYGIYKKQRTKMTREDLSWLKEFLPVAARLYHDERFFRAFSIYEQTQWSTTIEISTVLIWAAVETLFDLGAEREKTRAICKALSDYVSTSQSDRGRAYQVIRELYQKRGRIVHVGRSVAPEDFMQSFQLARVAFRRVLIDGALPKSPEKILH